MVVERFQVGSFSGWQFFRKLRICWSFLGGYANLNHGTPVASQVADQTHLYMSLGDDIEKHFHCLNMLTFSVPGDTVCFFFPKKNISIKCWFIKVQRSHGMERRDGLSQQNWESKRVDLTKTIHFSSAERLLELAEGTLRILWIWMQQFSRGMFDVQLDLLLLLLVDVLKIHRICKRMCHIKQIGSHGSCTIFDRLWVARKLTTLIRANKTKHPGMDAGKYRDKRTNQVQTTYGPEDQHGTWE